MFFYANVNFLDRRRITMGIIDIMFPGDFLSFQMFSILCYYFSYPSLANVLIPPPWYFFFLLFPFRSSLMMFSPKIRWPLNTLSNTDTGYRGNRKICFCVNISILQNRLDRVYIIIKIITFKY